MEKETLVTREAVFAAAERIKARGDRVSYRQVRRELGGGSPRDICPLLREWRTLDSQGTKSNEDAAPIPPEIERVFRDAVARLAEAVRREAAGQFEIERHAAQQRINDAVAEGDDLAQDVAESEAEIASLRGQLAAAADAVTLERVRREEAEQQRDVDRQERQVAEARVEEVRQQVQDLVFQRDRLQAAQEDDRRRLAEIRDQAAQFQTDLQAEQLTQARLADEHAHLRQRIEELTAALQNARAELLVSREESARSIKSLRQECEEAKHESARLTGEALVLRSQARVAMASLRRRAAKGDQLPDIGPDGDRQDA